jgi:hypothetical protein
MPNGDVTGADPRFTWASLELLVALAEAYRDGVGPSDSTRVAEAIDVFLSKQGRPYPNGAWPSPDHTKPSDCDVD